MKAGESNIEAKAPPGEIGALDQLLQEVRNLSSREHIVQMCKLAVRMPTMAPFNAMLVYMQRPEATTVLSAATWQSHGRTIKPSARPIVVLQAFGPVKFVFDHADTDGETTPEQLSIGNLGGDAFGVAGQLSREHLVQFLGRCINFGIIAEERNAKLQRAGHARRLADDIFEIHLNIDFRTEQKFATLCHELAHIFCGHLGAAQGIAKDRSTRGTAIEETEAELTAYLVTKRFGVDANSGHYLKWFTEGGEVPEFSLETVLVATGKIESLLRGDLRKRK